jgi:hypothetical protein
VQWDWPRGHRNLTVLLTLPTKLQRVTSHPASSRRILRPPAEALPPDRPAPSPASPAPSRRPPRRAGTPAAAHRAQQQRALVTALAERAIDPDHGELDQVGLRALQRGVDRCALGESARVGIAAVNIGYRPLAPEQRAGHHVSNGGVDKFLHAGVELEVRSNVLLRFGAGDAELMPLRCAASNASSIWPAYSIAFEADAEL